MERRQPGSKHTRETHSELIEGRLSVPDARSGSVHLAAWQITEETLEAENRVTLGRGDDEQGDGPGSRYRNGNLPD